MRTIRSLLVANRGEIALRVMRTARRLGRTVTVLTLEPEGSLPAQKVEVDEAAEEAIRFVSGAMLQSAEAGDGAVTLNCIRVAFSKGERPGAFRVDPVAGSEFALSVHTVIPAIGQDADLQRWAGLLEATGPVIAAGKDWQTSTAGIYAGGDVASMARFVTQAVGMGKEAAHAIARALAPDIARAVQAELPEVGYDRINIAYQEPHGRTHQRLTEVAERLTTFDEVQQPLSADEAKSEADRCFSCGSCIYCDNCYFYCPDMAIARLGENGYEVDPDYCKGCGLCVAECPTGSIHMAKDDNA